MRVVWLLMLLMLLNEHRMLEVSVRDKAEKKKKEKAKKRENPIENGQHDRKRCKTDCGHTQRQWTTTVIKHRQSLSFSHLLTHSIENLAKTFCCTVWPDSQPA